MNPCDGGIPLILIVLEYDPVHFRAAKFTKFVAEGGSK